MHGSASDRTCRRLDAICAHCITSAYQLEVGVLAVFLGGFWRFWVFLCCFGSGFLWPRPRALLCFCVWALLSLCSLCVGSRAAVCLVSAWGLAQICFPFPTMMSILRYLCGILSSLLLNGTSCLMEPARFPPTTVGAHSTVCVGGLPRYAHIHTYIHNGHPGGEGFPTSRWVNPVHTHMCKR